MEFITRKANGQLASVQGINSFTGVGGQIPQTNSTGFIDNSLIGVRTGIHAFGSALSAGGLQESYNLTMVRAFRGAYDYTFDTPLPNSTYSVITTIMDKAVFNSNAVQVTLRTNSGFRVEGFDGDNGGSEDIRIDLRHSVLVLSNTVSPITTTQPQPAPLVNANIDSIVLGSNGSSDSTTNFNSTTTRTVILSSVADAPLDNNSFSHSNGVITTLYNGKVNLHADTDIATNSGTGNPRLRIWIEKNEVRISPWTKSTVSNATRTSNGRTDRLISCSIGDEFRVRIVRDDNSNSNDTVTLGTLPLFTAQRLY